MTEYDNPWVRLARKAGLGADDVEVKEADHDAARWRHVQQAADHAAARDDQPWMFGPFVQGPDHLHTLAYYSDGVSRCTVPDCDFKATPPRPLSAADEHGRPVIFDNDTIGDRAYRHLTWTLLADDGTERIERSYLGRDTRGRDIHLLRYAQRP